MPGHYKKTANTFTLDHPSLNSEKSVKNQALIYLSFFYNYDY